MVLVDHNLLHCSSLQLLEQDKMVPCIALVKGMHGMCTIFFQYLVQICIGKNAIVKLLVKDLIVQNQT